jgi:hypothetical protein
LVDPAVIFLLPWRFNCFLKHGAGRREPVGGDDPVIIHSHGPSLARRRGLFARVERPLRPHASDSSFGVSGVVETRCRHGQPPLKGACWVCKC